MWSTDVGTPDAGADAGADDDVRTGCNVKVAVSALHAGASVAQTCSKTAVTAPSSCATSSPIDDAGKVVVCIAGVPAVAYDDTNDTAATPLPSTGEASALVVTGNTSMSSSRPEMADMRLEGVPTG